MNSINAILASQSPRRRELLKYIFDDFDIIPPTCEEILPDGIGIYDSAEYLACQKAMSIAKVNPDSIVVGCDTVVIIDETILGKPKDEAQAFIMLKALSGRTHDVVSGVCLSYKGKTLSFSQKTSVTFYPLSDSEILEYIGVYRPLDKAGAYGIQDKGALFVKEISGDYFNIVGLPIARLNIELKKLIKLAGG